MSKPNHDEQTRQLLQKHYKSYPCLQPQDVFKFLFQSALGCEHLVASYDTALEYIKREQLSANVNAIPLVERLDGHYSRVYLSCLKDGLSAQTLAKLFCLSAKKEEDGHHLLQQKLRVATSLVEEGLLPLSKQDFHQKLNAWQHMGCPAIHHSDVFRQEYRPAYRVIDNKYANFLSVFCQIDKQLANGPVVVAIEGGSASGKSTLANIIAEVYDCNVVHMDDFFLRPEQRTPERLAQIGGNVDYERFAEQVIVPLGQAKTLSFCPFDCTKQALVDQVTLPHKQLTIVEGVYSLHPRFGNYQTLAVFLQISASLQKNRIAVRNSPALAQRFFDQWIPMENRYFDGARVQSRCNIIIDVDKLQN